MSLVWVYAVQSGSGEPDAAPPDAPGVDGESPRVVAGGDLAAIVGTVSVDDFDEQALASAMDDLARLEQLARAHHAVVAEAARNRAVAPLRLATVFRGDDAVERMLLTRQDEFAAVLARVRGRREWGVKVYVDELHPVDAAQAPAGSVATGDRPGMEYLMRRRAQRDRGERARGRARAIAEDVHATLAALAAAHHRFAPQDARLSGRRDEMVLNAGYLVDAAVEDGFRAAVAAGGTEGVTVELTGPWPPFSFATLDDSSDDSSGDGAGGTGVDR